MERWSEGPLIVSAWRGFVSEREGTLDRDAQEGGEDTVGPIDPITLRSSLLCGRGCRISVSRLELTLVSPAGHLLWEMSEEEHLSSSCQLQGDKKHQIALWWHHWSWKLCAAFNILPLVFLIERVEGLGCWNPGTVPQTPLYSTKIGSWIHSAQLAPPPALKQLKLM